MGIDLEWWKARIRTAVGELRAQLLGTSHDIHANPELLFMTAADLLAEPSLLAQAKAKFRRQLAAGEVAGRETWLARGQEYTGVTLQSLA